MLVGEFRVGDGYLALQRFELLLLVAARGRDLAVELTVDGGIDAADEEAGDAGDTFRVAAVRDEGFEAGDIGFENFRVHFLREQQRDVDADAFRDQLADRGHALAGAGDLHHQIVAVDIFPQPLRLGDSAIGVARQIGRDFQADKAIRAMKPVVNGVQCIRRALDVFHGEGFIEIAHRSVAFLQQRRDRAVIFVAAADRLFEDRRIGGDAAHTVLIDQRP